MFRKVFVTQTKLLLQQKEAVITFYIMLALCLINYINNVIDFQGYDVIEMVHPMKLLVLSANRTYYSADMTIFFMQLYPILVACPAGLAIVKEQHSRQELLAVSRINRTKYYAGKLLAAFIVTMVVFTVPFLVEMLLNCIAFPLDATGDLSYRGFYDENYIEDVGRYFMSGLYVKSPYVYTLLCTLMFGTVSGIFGTFIAAISILVRVKYKVLLFLPGYILLNATLYLENALSGAATGWYRYLLIFCDEKKSYLFFGGLLLFCTVIIVAAMIRGSKKELL